MSLPPGFLEELRNRVSLGRVVGRRVAWDGRKSNQAKGDLWAPCPFHQEKTASFHVDDRKGFYYCFGCHEKGDAISFVQKTENVPFIEAVGILAREAGMTMPAQDPRAAETASRATRLAEAMEMAVQHYRLQLATRAGEEARAYLSRRGLTEAAQARWEIGFAPDDRQGLSKALGAKGAAADLLLEAGLTGESDGRTYDRFSGRVIFPIRDARGRAIGLGGRSLDPQARAKYLNSPQTPLFDKGRNLYNHGPAREAAGKGATLVVAEGYMDVIALAEAGFAGAVAPLGTAITEEQLALLWRIADEPVVALDGDAAGLRAAMRLIDLALPRLEAGKGLRFALLPPGQDPDDLIRSKGAAAMQAVLDDAQPMVRLLWRRETEGRVFDSPERKAALDKSLRQAVATIRDPSIRRHYGEELKELRWQLWGPKPRGARRDARAAAPTPAARASALAGRAPEDLLREAVLAILAAAPSLVPEFAHDVEAMDCAPGTQAALRDAILRGDAGGAAGDLLAAPHIRILPALLNAGDLSLGRQTIRTALTDLASRASHEAVLREGMEDAPEADDEWLTRRLSQAAASVDTTRRKEAEDKREVVIAPNGFPLDRQDTERRDQVFSAIDPTRGGRGGHRRTP